MESLVASFFTSTATIQATNTIPSLIAPSPTSSSAIIKTSRQSTSLKQITAKPPPRLTTASPPKKPYNVLYFIFDTLEYMINTYIDRPLRPSDTLESILPGNFAPVVDELPPTECKVTHGTIPRSLNGAYIRNGPNPRVLPVGPYHPFDGDGMLHCLRISDGKVTLSSRYVRTNKYVSEERAGTSLTPNFISAFNSIVGSVMRGALSAVKILIWQFDLRDGIGVANTNLSHIGGKLYALCESDLPYEIRVTPEGDIETLGRRGHDVSFSAAINMTAHPKVDPDTGEVFAFRYFITSPYLTYFGFDSHGNHLPDLPISSMHSMTIIHDFAITKNYAVFPDIQIEVDPLGFLFGGSPPIGFNSQKVPRLGLIPRYAKDDKEIMWFDVPGFNICHVANGWDEEDVDGNRSVVVVAPNVLSIEQGFKRLDLFYGQMEMVRIDLDSGNTVTRKVLSRENLEFPVINSTYVGKKNRYVYAAITDYVPRMTGVVKLDLEMAAKGGDVEQDCVVARRNWGAGCYGGEVFFVARDEEGRSNVEDDGYLVSYVHDESKNESRFIVMDARSPGLDIIASVKLSGRVPYGFHGLFVKEDNLQGFQA